MNLSSSYHVFITKTSFKRVHNISYVLIVDIKVGENYHCFSYVSCDEAISLLCIKQWPLCHYHCGV